MQDSSAATSAWKSSNGSFVRTCRLSFPLTTRRRVPSQHMQSRNETCQRAAPGSCAAQALHNVTCSPAAQDHSCSAIPTRLLCNLLAPALSCYTHVPQKFPCLLQVLHRPFVKPKAAFASWDISWQEGKTVLELLQPSDWHVCRFAPCSLERREIRSGKGDGERCSKRGQDRLPRDRKKGSLPVRKKTSEVFCFCVNLVVLGQI